MANRLTLSDFDNPALPTISRMMSRGSVGLISPNCAGPKGEYALLLTAGAGSSCRGGADVRECYDASEKTFSGEYTAGEAHARRMGCRVPAGSAVFLGMGPVLRANVESAKPAVLGACGDAIRAAGLKTCAVGNADVPPLRIDRAAAVLAMDSRGIIDIGRLSAVPSRRSPNDPCGLGSDSGELLRVAREGLRAADYVVIDYGATARLDEYKLSMSDNALSKHKAEVLSGLDRFLAALIRTPETKNAKFMLVSFGLPDGDPWDRLTPMVLYPSKTPGLLTSPTTRTRGLIAASDFAPSVLHVFGIPPSVEMLGRSITETRVPHKMDVLRDLDIQVQSHRDMVVWVIYVVMFVSGLAFVSATVLVAFNLKAPKWVSSATRVGLVTACAFAVAMLLGTLSPAGIVPHSLGIFISLVIIVGLSFIIGLPLARRTGLIAGPALALFGLSSVIILIDATLGGPLCKFALPSSFQLSGLRFYGIGNEYAGLLIGMSALFALLSGTTARRWLVPVLGSLVVVTMGVGRMGANYGATLAAVVTFGLMWLAAWRGRYGLRHVVGVFGAGFALLIVLALLDSKFSGGGAAHAGRVTGLVEKVGADYLVAMVSRKVLLNLMIAALPWAIMAYSVLGAIIAFVTYKFPSQFKKELFKDKHVTAGLKGLMVGMLAALLFNDSGIVMALLMLGMMGVVLLYSFLDIKDRLENTDCRE
ncbi:hypothetical protein LLG39_15595 [bacterium]|nr:hypothetical protein [bacterium]